jgi:hypothetical protein
MILNNNYVRPKIIILPIVQSKHCLMSKVWWLKSDSHIEIA